MSAIEDVQKVIEKLEAIEADPNRYVEARANRVTQEWLLELYKPDALQVLTHRWYNGILIFTAPEIPVNRIAFLKADGTVEVIRFDRAG